MDGLPKDHERIAPPACRRLFAVPSRLEKPCTQIEAIAKKHQARVVYDRASINGSDASLKGLSLGAVDDITALPLLLANYVGTRVVTAVNNIIPSFEYPIDEEAPAKDRKKLILIPGFGASNHHLDRLVQHLPGIALAHPAFQKRRLTERVLDDSDIVAADILKTGRATDIGGHSRGGLVALCALKLLQDAHRDHLVEKVLLFSPASHGMRTEIGQYAQHLGLGSIQDLCSGSAATSFWQGLSANNRAKVTVVSQEGGDAFTSPQYSFVEGGTMVIAPHCGHQDSIRNTATAYFKLSVELAQHRH